ncbi:VWA domain-containing protein, partial [Pseudomonas sp. zjy_13]|uniref:vWA domain-containing protein n=1 Tax=Pseudomonas sp. zjy_13 TaxID=3367263 RepID=UPI00370C91FB
DANGQADAQPGADAQDQADAQPDADDNGQADAQPGADAQDQADAQPDADANGQADAKPYAMPETYLPELGSCIEDMLKELASQNTSTLPSPMPVSTAMMGNPDKASDRYQVGRLSAAGIRQAFRSVFQGRLASQVFHRDSGRHLDRNKLARVPAGQRDVFIHRTEKADVNCAIQFLVDVSSSMATSVSVAETALMGMLESLEGLKGITTGAMAFPTATGEAIKLKSHKERFKRLLNKGNFGLTTHGTTPLAEALWPAAIQLLRESDVSARKILIIVTDGDPNSREQALEMTQLIKDSGIDVYCLGFGSVDSLFLNRCFGKKGIDVQSVENLSNSLFKVLKNNI